VIMITRITRKPVDIDFTVTLSDGNPGTPTGVQVAVLNRRDTPSAVTTWEDVTYTAGVISLTVAGPEADPTDALPVPQDGADLWAKVSDASYVDAVPLMTVRVEGGGTGLSVLPQHVPSGGSEGQILGIVNGRLAWVTPITYPGTTGIS
jgi:hypothetical protein